MKVLTAILAAALVAGWMGWAGQTAWAANPSAGNSSMSCPVTPIRPPVNRINTGTGGVGIVGQPQSRLDNLFPPVPQPTPGYWSMRMVRDPLYNPIPDPSINLGAAGWKPVQTANPGWIMGWKVRPRVGAP